MSTITTVASNPWALGEMIAVAINLFAAGMSIINFHRKNKQVVLLRDEVRQLVNSNSIQRITIQAYERSTTPAVTSSIATAPNRPVVTSTIERLRLVDNNEYSIRYLQEAVRANIISNNEAVTILSNLQRLSEAFATLRLNAKDKIIEPIAHDEYYEEVIN